MLKEKKLKGIEEDFEEEELEEELEDENEEELEDEKEEENVNDKKMLNEIKKMELIYDEELKHLKEDETTILNMKDDSVRFYFKSIIAYDVLTDKEERELLPYLKQRNIALNKLNDYEDGKLELSDEEYKKYQKIYEDNNWVREKLINHNLRLVVSIAKKYYTYTKNLEFLDIIQEGNIGLMKAVDKFDPTLEFKFSTYATWWIRQSITRAIGDNDRIIRIPIHIVEKINAYLKFKNTYFTDHSCEPSDDYCIKELYYNDWEKEFIKKNGHKPSKDDIDRANSSFSNRLELIKNYLLSPLSLESKINNGTNDSDENTVLGDFVEDTKMIKPDEFVTKEFMKKDIDALLTKILDDRQKYVIGMRFGLIDGENHTLEEIAGQLGVTRERIRQIEAKSLILLRRSSEGKKLRTYINGGDLENEEGQQKQEK